MRTLEIAYFGRKRRHIANPLTALVILPLASVPVITGVFLWNQPLAAFAAFILFSVLFFGSYLLGMRFAYGVARELNKSAHRARIGTASKARSSATPMHSQPPEAATPPWVATKESTRMYSEEHRPFGVRH